MASNSHLFKWRRQTSPLGNARGKKKDPLEKWIKKINDASEIAANEAFGATVLEKTDLLEVTPDDETVYEAQQLLDGWLKEKSLPDITHDEFDIQSEWSNQYAPLSSTKGVPTFFESTETPHSDGREEYAKGYLKIQEYDDDDDISQQLLVDEVMHGMLNKDFTKDLGDLGMKPMVTKFKDPVPKMNLRHEQVKNKGQMRRKRDAEVKQKNKLKEEIKHKAEEQVSREERKKFERHQQEEKAIQEEMEKIREELKEEKQKRKKELQRKAKILEEAKLEMQRELRKQKQEEKQRRLQKQRHEEENRFRKDVEDQQQTIVNMKCDMQILHKHFAIWYNMVLQRRVLSGKARAVCDWKAKVKAWNSWKAYVSHIKSNYEAMAIEQKMKENYRKEQMALTHFNRKLIGVCFHSWRRYSSHKMSKKLLKFEHENKAKKMAMFMENVSKHLLVVNNEIEDEQEEERESFLEMVIEQLQEKEESTISNDNVNVSGTRCVTHTVNVDGTRQHQRRIMATFNGKKGVNVSSGPSPHGERSRKHMGKIKPHISELVSDCGNDPLGRHSQRDKKNPTVYDFVDGEVDSKSETTSMTSTPRIPTDNQSTSVAWTPRVRSEKPTTKPLHLAMEERALQRKAQREKIEAEKRRREEEKLKELKAKQEERLRNEELEKRERVKRRKDEKQKEAEKEQRKLDTIAALRAKTELSADHYTKKLLKKYGIEPLKRLVQVSLLNERISEKFYNKVVLKKFFNEWRVSTRDIVKEKQHRADVKYHEILLKRSMRSWKKCRFHLQMLSKLARGHSIVRIKRRCFTSWKDYVIDERILLWSKESDAEQHDLIRTRKKYFHMWRRFVQSEKDERLRETRRDVLRKKVRQWLPDYQPSTQT